MPLIYVNIIINEYRQGCNFCLDFVHYQKDLIPRNNFESSISFLSEKNESLVSKYIQIEKNETNVKNLRAKSK